MSADSQLAKKGIWPFTAKACSSNRNIWFDWKDAGRHGIRQLSVAKMTSLSEPSMLRLTDIKLPLDHGGSALTDAILARLGIAADELTGYTVAKRSYDARKRAAGSC